MALHPTQSDRDDTLFRQLLDIIFKAPEWDAQHWNQEPTAGIEFNAAAFKIKGLVDIVSGEREWWPYQVDRKRLRTEGPAAIAREFMAQYAEQRAFG